MSPLLQDAKGIFVGTTPAEAVYMGTRRVWPPTTSDLWVDQFDRVAATIAAMGNGWNVAGSGAAGNCNGADLTLTHGGFYGLLFTPTTVPGGLPADIGIEVIAPRATWSGGFSGIAVRWNGTSGVKAFLQDSSAVMIGNANDWASNNTTVTLDNGFPAGWTNAGDHSLRLEVRGLRCDIFCDNVLYGHYTVGTGSFGNEGLTNQQVGIVSDAGGSRVYRSIRVYPVTGTTP